MLAAEAADQKRTVVVTLVAADGGASVNVLFGAKK